MAVLTALLATALLMGLGLSIALIGTTDAALAAHDRTSRALREASLAAAYLAVADLRGQPSWSSVLAPGAATIVSAAPGRFLDADLAPLAPWDGSVLDLRAMTADVAADADTGGGDPQVWRLFASGRLPLLMPDAAVAPWYLAAWVADDRADGDGDPLADANGILVLRAVAFGPRGARVATRVSAMKTLVAGTARVRILTIRPWP